MIFIIKFEPLPRVDGIRALRALLKASLRRYGLRAIDAREETAAPAAEQFDHRRGSDCARKSANQEQRMDMTAYVGAKFVRYEDVKDKPQRGKIVSVKVGQYDKPVLELDTGGKLSLNGTNCRVLVESLGGNSRGWIGHAIELFAGQTVFQGAPQDSVLVRALTAPTEQQKAEQPKRTPPPPPPPRRDLDDEIPF